MMPATSSAVVGVVWDAGSTAGLPPSALLDRFAARQDEASFAALVARHGPMVRATCRRILPGGSGAEADVDDAFQATFLVLARRAGSIRDGDRLAPWLHRVARRAAGRVRQRARTRQHHEAEAGLRLDPVTADPSLAGDLANAELRAVLDDELERLPTKLRDPLILCYLDGLTHDEAARLLGWPVGTVRSRLASGRDRLRARLTRRGFAPSALLVLADPTLPSALVSPLLQAASVRLALTFTPGVLAGRAALPAAVLIAQGVSPTMIFTKTTIVATLALGTCALGTTLGIGATRSGSTPADDPPASATAAPALPQQPTAPAPPAPPASPAAAVATATPTVPARDALDAAQARIRALEAELADLKARLARTEATQKAIDEVNVLTQGNLDRFASPAPRLDTPFEPVGASVAAIAPVLVPSNPPVPPTPPDTRLIQPTLPSREIAAPAAPAAPPAGPLPYDPYVATPGSTVVVAPVPPPPPATPDYRIIRPTLPSQEASAPQAARRVNPPAAPGTPDINYTIMAPYTTMTPSQPTTPLVPPTPPAAPDTRLIQPTLPAREAASPTVPPADASGSATGAARPRSFRDMAPRRGAQPPLANSRPELTPTKPTASTMVLPGTAQVLTIPATRDSATVFNSGNGERATYRRPEGVTGLNFVASAATVGLSFEGPRINQVAAWSRRGNRWAVLDLREPVTQGSLMPLVNQHFVGYQVGRFCYAFAAESYRWDVLELPPSADGKYPTLTVGPDATTVTDADQIHVFNYETGQWRSTRLDGRDTADTAAATGNATATAAPNPN